MEKKINFNYSLANHASMLIRLSLSIVLFCTACQSGLIPCARVKTAKLKRSTGHRPFFQLESSMSAKSDGASNLHSKSYKESADRFTTNISVEDWDCPRPGKKKYLPKAIKGNIKRNMRKIKSDDKKKADKPTESVQ